jgi:rhodanese-related sulfurtransferase
MSVGRIGREELRRLVEDGAVAVVDALPPISYAASHLPGAVNIPPESVDGRAHRRLPDPDARIVVYCANETCDSSALVAERLVELGYRNVLHYPGGKRDWAEGGLPLEGGRASRPRPV